ncbi:MAG: beta-phosphoglucomutase [Oscillatoria sp. SIO1A7]|nr:beta-phosphoglucomutase [Oscillatoria sp. SIO1A7]
MDAQGTSPHFLYTDWSLTETQFDPTTQHQKETVFTIGNGYLETRGSFEEGYPGDWPATLINGVYDDVPIVHTELANCPDWLALAIAIDTESSTETLRERFRLDQGEILSYQRQLDLRQGLLDRLVRWRSPAGHTIDLHFQRFASLADRHWLAHSIELTPLNFQGSVEIQASINGYPENQGVMHWQWVNQGEMKHKGGRPQGVWLHLRTRSSGIDLGMASSIAVNGAQDPEIQFKGCEGHPTLAATFSVRPGQTVSLEKIVAVFTSRENSDPARAAREALQQQPSYSTLRSNHEAAWANIWQDCDISIEGDLKAQLAVRYSIFQLLASAPHEDERCSIPAKTLSGFGYRGHVFWDTELFILPGFLYTQPKIARNLLTYRYHTLSGSRRKARDNGYPGARLAWESADTGNEVTPRWLFLEESNGDPTRIWFGDRQLHISSDVAYAIWQYWQATGDDDWMQRYGAEIILDTAVFWGSRIEWDGKREIYEIRNVIGPDEDHQRVDNNAFTNRLVQWHLEKALATIEWLGRVAPERLAELESKLDLTPDRRDRWADMVRRLWIPYDPNSGLIEQFDGFFDLEDINLKDYEPRDRSMYSILGGVEGTSKRQVIKQPDVLMLLYVLRGSVNGDSSFNVAKPKNTLEYSRQVLEKNWNYYEPRTDHSYGSSLGPAIHAALACNLDKPAEAYEHFMRAAMVDIEDVRGNANDGIHAASAGALWQAVLFGFGGVRFERPTPDAPVQPVANPHLPPKWTRLKFKIQWRGASYDFDLQSQGARMNSDNTSKPKIRGVIFDLDGVLTDTAEFHYLGWQRVADEERIPFDRQANEAMRGLSRRDSLLKLLGDAIVSEEKMQEMMERKNRYYLELIGQMGAQHLLGGAGELLDELHSTGIKIAIGSASKNARVVIERLEIADRIEVIADGHSVTRSKPAPDLFLYAANELGLSPEECLVVEDAASGVEAALAAGMQAVGLGPSDRVGAAHVVLPNLEGVRWAELLAKLAPI